MISFPASSKKMQAMCQHWYSDEGTVRGTVCPVVCGPSENLDEKPCTQSMMVGASQGEGLPAQIAALSQARHSQAADLARRKAVLCGLEEQLARARYEREHLETKGNDLVLKACILQEEGIRTKRQSDDLERQMLLKLSNFGDLESEVKKKENLFENTQRTYSEYFEKMEVYRAKVTEAEKETQEMKQVAELEQRVRDLNKHKLDLERIIEEKLEKAGYKGKTLVGMESVLEESRTTIDQQRKRVKDKEQKLADLQNENKKLETANMILKKRNSACLTRLQRQVNEQREKYTQLMSTIQHATERITATRTKLTQLDTGH